MAGGGGINRTAKDFEEAEKFDQAAKEARELKNGKANTATQEQILNAQIARLPYAQMGISEDEVRRRQYIKENASSNEEVTTGSIEAAQLGTLVGTVPDQRQ